MPEFAYQARDRAGNPVRGRIEGHSVQAVLEQLRGLGLTVTRVTAAGGAGRAAAIAAGRAAEVGAGAAQAGSIWTRPLGSRRMPPAALGLFCRQFATLFAVGVPIVTALRALADQAGRAPHAGALRAVARRLEEGETLSAAFAEQGAAFPPLMVQMVAAAEASGAVEQVFTQLGEHFEREHALQQKVRGALFYPAFVIAVAAAVVALLVTLVLPTYVKLFEAARAPLPWPTRALLAFAAGVARGWPYLLGGLAGLAWAFWSWAGTAGGRRLVDRALLLLPAVGGIVHMRVIARLARTMATLLGAGVPLLRALEISGRVLGNVAVAGALLEAQRAVAEGGRMSDSLRSSRWFPPLLVEMIAVGEATGALDTLLGRGAQFFEAELDRRIGRLTALIEPVLITGLALVVGFILISIVMPMFDVFSKI